ncbi:carboxypeptidase-like regulatory domain-containing protein [Echinicola arenosa]|nr:carboxypeptidase-like regulatory domain-containing protein [Echinicola arenosa]
MLFFFNVNQLNAQGRLEDRISLDQVNDKSIGEILELSSKDRGFFFSYNSNLVPEDSLVNLPSYSGPIRGMLLKLLGSKYEFIETPGYIVIRYAPNKLYLDDSNETELGKNWLITGRVKDLSSDELIAFASVYDQRLLTSAVTDKNGYFELRVKNPDQSLMLTISKENYRDTTFMLLPTFDLSAKKKKGIFEYYGTSSENVEETFLGRMFIGFRQRMQGINLGGFFAEMPYQVSLVPGLSSHGMLNSQIINHVSLNVWGGYTAGVDGVELAGLFNINKKDVSFVQAAGLFNLVGGNQKGIQLSGLSNKVFGTATGFQATGLSNMTHEFEGFQVAGLFNQATDVKGIQIGGLFNWSSGDTGVQIAGLFNHAKNAKGMQLAGLFNVADSSSFPIGLVNLIKFGEKSFSFGIDELDVGSITMRTGGQHSYGLVGLGYHLRGSQRVSIDGGLGIHLIRTGGFALDSELAGRVSLGDINTTYNLATLRLIPAVNLHKHWRVFVAPSINYLFSEDAEETDIPGWGLGKPDYSDGVLGGYVGLSAGIQFVFI